MAMFPEGIFTQYAKNLTRISSKARKAGIDVAKAKSQLDAAIEAARKAHKSGNMEEYNRIKEQIRVTLGNINAGNAPDSLKVRDAAMARMEAEAPKPKAKAKNEPKKASPSKKSGSNEWSEEEIAAELEAESAANKKKAAARMESTAERQIKSAQAVKLTEKQLNSVDARVRRINRALQERGDEPMSEAAEKRFRDKEYEKILTGDGRIPYNATEKQFVEGKQYSPKELAAAKQQNKRRRARGEASMNEDEFKAFIEDFRNPKRAPKPKTAAKAEPKSEPLPEPKTKAKEEPKKKDLATINKEREKLGMEPLKESGRLLDDKRYPTRRKVNRPETGKMPSQAVADEVGKLGAAANRIGIAKGDPYKHGPFRRFVKNNPDINVRELEKAWRDGWITG